MNPLRSLLYILWPYVVLGRDAVEEVWDLESGREGGGGRAAGRCEQSGSKVVSISGAGLEGHGHGPSLCLFLRAV